MRYIQEILSNRVLLIAVTAWMAAQLAKIIFTAIIEKRWTWSWTQLFFGLGGMPSSHSATVTSLATAIGIAKGFHSPEFALSAMLAFITMTDAAGVRRAAGRQAVVLNQLVKDLIDVGKSPTKEKLKEMLGHTPFEVVIGALLGILVALIFM